MGNFHLKTNNLVNVAHFCHHKPFLINVGRSDEAGRPLSAHWAPHADSDVRDVRQNRNSSRPLQKNANTEVCFCFFKSLILCVRSELHAQISEDCLNSRREAETENASCYQSQHQPKTLRTTGMQRASTRVKDGLCCTKSNICICFYKWMQTDRRTHAILMSKFCFLSSLIHFTVTALLFLFIKMHICRSRPSVEDGFGQCDASHWFVNHCYEAVSFGARRDGELHRQCGC